MYPHLECVDDLRYVSDLTYPANWFPLARAKQRKIIIHAGPTNSGKTYHAFQRYLESRSAIYCGPLKMLAVEIFNKSNAADIDCDLVTGEERKFADPDGKKEAAHVACTVEMTDIERDIEVAIIDEIQMLRDTQRGWAWLRAFLGVNADEVHLCGEETAIDLIQNLALDTGDTVEIRRYKRLTPIEYMNQAVGDMASVQEGDCIVCFSKSHIYHVCRELEKLGKQCAVIYGSLPPGTKMAQAAKFNDPTDPCKILVATDAIGMGLNLNIRRVVFYTLTKRSEENGTKRSIVIPPSQALQIAGRCGRYGTTHKDKGYVTTFNAEDLEMLHELLQQPLAPIEQAGIHPTADQVELFGYYLPNATLSDLIDIFTTVMTIDNEKYFLCQMDQFKKIAEVIEHVPIPLRSRYIFCCAPIPLQSAFVTTTLLKFVRRFSTGQALTIQWLKEQIEWPLNKPVSVNDLTHLEAVHDTLDLYNWLSYRFEDQFPDRELVRELQTILDEQILSGVTEITSLSTGTGPQTKKMAKNDGQIKRLLMNLKMRRGDSEL
ncbi:ATP-dependent RNA helicase SUPV3L1, mitochondrial-like isoform X2 [Watersipora subatra]